MHGDKEECSVLVLLGISVGVDYYYYYWTTISWITDPGSGLLYWSGVLHTLLLWEEILCCYWWQYIHLWNSVLWCASRFSSGSCSICLVSSIIDIEIIFNYASCTSQCSNIKSFSRIFIVFLGENYLTNFLQLHTDQCYSLTNTIFWKLCFYNFVEIIIATKLRFLLP